MFDRIMNALADFFHNCSPIITERDRVVIIGLESRTLFAINCGVCDKRKASVKFWDNDLRTKSKFCKKYGIVRENGQYVIKNSKK